MIFDDVDKAFIAETYPDPEWTVEAIAEALEKEPGQVRGYAVYAGLKRPRGRGGRVKHNWLTLWKEVKSGKSVYAAADVMGMPQGAAHYAMTRMRVMTSEQREALWQERGFK